MGGVVLVPFMSVVEVILMLSSLLGQGFYNRAATTILLKKKKLKIEKIQYLLMNWNLIYISWKITRKLHGFDLRYNLRKVHLVS